MAQSVDKNVLGTNKFRTKRKKGPIESSPSRPKISWKAFAPNMHSSPGYLASVSTKWKSKRALTELDCALYMIDEYFNKIQSFHGINQIPKTEA